MKHFLTICLQLYGLEYSSSNIQTEFPRRIPGFPQAHFYNEMVKYGFDNINYIFQLVRIIPERDYHVSSRHLALIGRIFRKFDILSIFPEICRENQLPLIFDKNNGFNIHRSMHRYYIRRVPTRSNVSQFLYFCKTLYMFQTGFPSIIKSSKLYIQLQVFVRPLLLPAASLTRLAAGSST